MLFAVDVGNTDIVYGVYHNGEWTAIWRIPALVDESFKYYESDIHLHFLENNILMRQVDQVVYSSVVPQINPVLIALLRAIFHVDPVVVSAETSGGLQIAIDYPYELGSDLIANAVAAHHRYHRNCVVVDFGTALTFTTISAAGSVLGVAIVPGLLTAVNSLFSNTAQLPQVPLSLPASAIGKNTVHSIQAGILMGYEFLVRGLIQKIKAELNGDCIVIATGGLSSIIATLADEFIEIDKHLTLDGLRLIGASKNSG